MISIFNPTLAATWTSERCVPCGSNTPVVTMTNQPVMQAPQHSCGCHQAPKCNCHCNTPTQTVTGNNCQYQWAISPTRVAVSGLVTFTAVNLPANQAFQVLVQGNNAEYVWQLTSDAQGKVTGQQLQLPVNGSVFIFKPIVAGCNAVPAAQEVTMEACNAPPATTCNGTVTIQPQFALQQTEAGQAVIVALVISNTNTNPVNNINLPNVQLPATLSGSPLSVSQFSMAGNSQVTKSFTVVPLNATTEDKVATIDIPSNTGTYVCNGQTFSMGGGQASVVIKAGVKTICGLEIQGLTLSPNPVASGATVTATLVIRNTGNDTITNATLTNLLLDNPPTITTSPASATLSFTGVSIAAGATHVATSQFTISKSAGGSVVHTITIPANAVTATCNGSLIGNPAPYSATLVIN